MTAPYHPRWSRLGVPLFVLGSISPALGCSDEEPFSTATDGRGTEPNASSESTSAADSTLGTDTGENQGVAARGIRFERVEANQGVAIPIALEDGPVAAEERIAPLIANRRMLIRVFWALESAWEPREIEAQLHLTHADGSREVLSQTKLVTGPSGPHSLEDTFYWGLEAETVQPGLRYHVSLWEATATDMTNEDEDEAPRVPADGSAMIGVEDTRLVLHVVLVPFISQSGCGARPDTSEEALQTFHDTLYMMMPVDQVKLEVREPVVWTEPLSNLSPVHLSTLRFEDGAPPEAFYYGLVESCGAGMAGVALIPDDPTTPNAAHQRVGLGPSGDARTFVHEIGHNLGRFHISCGLESGWDATYPYDDAVVNEWGFGVLDYQLRHPTVHRDFMSYCFPQWVGAWGWNRMFSVIRIINTWAETDARYEGSLIVGLLGESGEEWWHTVPGALASHMRADNVQIEFASGDSILAVHPAYVGVLADMAAGQSLLIAELPAVFNQVTKITRIDGEKRIPIARSRLVHGHHHLQASLGERRRANHRQEEHGDQRGPAARTR